MMRIVFPFASNILSWILLTASTASASFLAPNHPYNHPSLLLPLQKGTLQHPRRPKQHTFITATTASDVSVEAEPYCFHPIDYSAANEYIGECYKHVFQEDSYFENGANSGPFDENNHRNHPMEPIYNARKGVLLLRRREEDTHALHPKLIPATLEHNGFMLLGHAASQVTDWNNLPQIKSIYIPELTEIIRNQLFPKETIETIIFWNPMFRGENQSVTNVERDMNQIHPPTSPTAGMVHIDQDICAHTTDSILNLINNNRIIDEDDKKMKEINKRIHDDGYRFMILNFWRNTRSEEPIKRQPLAVFSPYYNPQENGKQHFYFPKAKPDPKKSKWYTYPEMKSDEILIFKQYDRDGSYPSDIWHCALKSITDETALPRKSFDIRALIVLPTKVQPGNDRFHPDRLRPIM